MNFIPLTLAGFLLSNICFGQVPVSQEPRHHKVLDNGHVRLLDVRLPPGDTTQFHIHATPSVFVVLTDAKTGSQVISEEDHSSLPIKHYGNIWFEGFYMKPRIHRVYNMDEHLFNVMDIELTNTDFKTIDPSITLDGFTYLFEEKPVRSYRLILLQGQGVSVPSRKADVLIIQLNDSSDNPGMQVFVPDVRLPGTNRFNKKGYYMYVNSGTPFALKNEGSGKAEFAFFELK
jgi:hypothetical protein